MASTNATFVTVTESSHFIGAVALHNSLRIVGHDEPFVVIDCGLDDWQREMLSPVATIVPGPDDVPPPLMKPEAALAVRTGVAVVLDADVIVTRPLTELCDLAADGKIVVFANKETDRFFSEWGELANGIAPKRRPYAASGHLLLDPVVHAEYLETFRRWQRQLDLTKTFMAPEPLVSRPSPADAFYYGDMDVANALFATLVPVEAQAIIDYRLAPHVPFEGVRLVDAQTLECRYEDGVAPFLLHHPLRKPWLAATPQNVYSRLLPRLLLGDDVTLRFDPDQLPRRLRMGRLAAADRSRAGVQAALRSRLRGKLGIRPRIAALRKV